MNHTPSAPLPRHGGDLAAARRRHGEPDGGWLDLSTGINPEPWPAAQVPAGLLHHLPEPGDLRGLIEAARAAYGVPAGVGIAAAAGTDLAIRLLPLVAPAGPVTVVGPTYRSHREAWANAGRSVRETAAPDAAGGIVVVTNPNNPDGRTVSRAELAGLGHRLADAGGLLVVDEAFADVEPEGSIIPDLDRSPAVVFRSFGKFFGLGGLRLGFVAGPQVVIEALARLLGDWPVSAAAIAVGTAALGDAAWQASARDRIRERSAMVRLILESLGLTLVGDAGLFFLIDHPDARGLHERLAQRGVWTRIFDDQPTWLRIGLPAESDLPRLDAVLGSVLR